MTRKEILEIRKQFTITNCTITKICGCYIDEEKQIALQFSDNFLRLPEELAFKYLDIFKKTLSGKVNKNLLNISYKTNEEGAGSAHSLLMNLKMSRLSDQTFLTEFYENIIESYNYAGKYMILLLHGVYDVPGRSTDGITMEDASEEVYEHVLCAICPVDLSDSGLCINLDDPSVETRIRDWVVKPPMHGFLFPAFNDRQTDIHGVLFYTKKDTDLQEGFTKGVLGCKEIISGSIQKDFFKDVLTNTLQNTNGCQVMQNIQGAVRKKTNEMDEEEATLTKRECMDLLIEAGMAESSIEVVSAVYDQTFGEKGSVLADSITETAKTTIEIGTIKVVIPDKGKEQVTFLEVNGRKCIAIYPDGPIKLNGVETHI